MSDVGQTQSAPLRRTVVRGVLTFAVSTGLGVALLMAAGVSAPAAASIALGASIAALILSAA